MKTLILAVMIAVCTKPTLAGEKAMVLPVETPRGAQPHGKNLWRVSIAALAVANVMDAQSSWGKRELNQNLAGSSGRFDRESVLLKVGISTVVCTVEYLVLHRRPSASLYRKLAFVNFGDASLTGAMAIRNYGIPRN